jgi:hypothetical protein
MGMESKSDRFWTNLDWLELRCPRIPIIWILPELVTSVLPLEYPYNSAEFTILTIIFAGILHTKTRGNETDSKTKTASIDTLGETIKIPASYEINDKFLLCMYLPEVWQILTFFSIEHNTVILYYEAEEYEIVNFP